MIIKLFTVIGVILSLISQPVLAEKKQIALTIDDLPFVGTTHNKPGNLRREKERFLRMLTTLNQYKVPAIGFVIAGTIEKGQQELLNQFVDDGYVIGNHTYSHLNLNRVNVTRYQDNIARADQILAPLMTKPKFFRYPYLADGRGQKKQKIIDYLSKQDYIIAPVTIDSKDFKFNAQILNIYWRNRLNHLPSIKKRYLNYIWRQTLRAEKLATQKVKRPVKHILLIHANYLNSYAIGDIIEMYQKNGYEFISLEEAMKDSYHHSSSNL